MLASAKELGLAEASSGILELPADAPLGQPLREYLQLDEPCWSLNVTPNRGDAMSILGIAREVAALDRHARCTGPAIARRRSRASATRFPVQLEAPAACPRFVGLHHARRRQSRRRRRCGCASGCAARACAPSARSWTSPTTCMLELGPADARLRSGEAHGRASRVRLARAGEALTLLDGEDGQRAGPDVLLITDREGPVGLAGIMGGERTAVSAETTRRVSRSRLVRARRDPRPRAPLGPAHRCQPALRARRGSRRGRRARSSAPSRC